MGAYIERPSTASSSLDPCTQPNSTTLLQTHAMADDRPRGIVATHIEEMEELEGLGYHKAMIAGAMAGVAEHVFMFPVDTIKTRLQVSGRAGMPAYEGVAHAFKQIVRTEGFFRLYRGITAVVAGAGPSHAAHFATYEFVKHRFGGNEPGHHPLIHGFAGACGVSAHDAVATPLDVIKQRLQVFKHVDAPRGNAGAWTCARNIVRHEGVSALWASYPTTLAMNVPFMATHFAVYEGLKKLLHDHVLRPHSHSSDIASHILAGAGAGAVGAFVSTPLDVVKTTIQVEGNRDGLLSVMRLLYDRGGARIFFRGVTARMLYVMPSSAICWTTYEGVKRWLV